RFNWLSLIAGDDISPYVPILDRTNADPDHTNTLQSVSTLVRSAYKAQRLEQIEDEVLQPYGLTCEQFRTRAKEELTERTYDRIREEIRRFNFSLEILVAGYDPKPGAHIFTVESPGKCSYYDKIGFWAIGSGQHQAVNSLFATKFSRLES